MSPLPVANLIAPVVAPLFGGTLWFLPTFVCIIAIFETTLFRVLHDQRTRLMPLFIVVFATNMVSSIIGIIVTHDMDSRLYMMWKRDPYWTQPRALALLFGIYSIACLLTILIEYPIMRAGAKRCNLQRVLFRTAIVNLASYVCIIGLLLHGLF